MIMKKQNICQVSNEFIHVTIFQKKKKYFKKSTFCKSNRKEFKKFSPEKIKITSVNYRSKKLNSPRLGSRSKVQGRFLRELT